MCRLTYLNESRETTELTQFEGDSWEELIKNADTVDQVFMHNAIDKLYEYEELEEQGLLLKLPCKLGDTVYSIEVYEIQEFVATRFDVDKNGIHAFHKNIYIGEMGNSVFATQEEAEQELKDWKVQNARNRDFK